MKKIIYLFTLAAFSFVFTNCENEDDSALEQKQSVEDLLQQQGQYFASLVKKSGKDELTYKPNLTKEQVAKLAEYYGDKTSASVDMKNVASRLKSSNIEYWAELDRTTLKAVAQKGQSWVENPSYRFECYTGSYIGSSRNYVRHVFRIFNWHVDYTPGCGCSDTPYMTMTASGYGSVSSIWTYTYDRDDPDFDLLNHPTHLYGEHYIGNLGYVYTFRDASVYTNWWVK